MKKILSTILIFIITFNLSIKTFSLENNSNGENEDASKLEVCEFYKENASELQSLIKKRAMTLISNINQKVNLDAARYFVQFCQSFGNQTAIDNADRINYAKTLIDSDIIEKISPEELSSAIDSGKKETFSFALATILGYAGCLAMFSFATATAVILLPLAGIYFQNKNLEKSSYELQHEIALHKQFYDKINTLCV